MALNEVNKKRREKVRELMKQYDKEVYNLEVKKITEECEHDGQHIAVMMFYKNQCHITCCGCGKTIWRGSPDEIPKTLNYSWSQDSF